MIYTDAADNRQKEVIKAQVEHPNSVFHYETLNKALKGIRLCILGDYENRPETNECRKKFEIRTQEQLPVNVYDIITSKIYEEVR